MPGSHFLSGTSCVVMGRYLNSSFFTLSDKTHIPLNYCWRVGASMKWSTHRIGELLSRLELCLNQKLVSHPYLVLLHNSSKVTVSWIFSAWVAIDQGVSFSNGNIYKHENQRQNKIHASSVYMMWCSMFTVICFLVPVGVLGDSGETSTSKCRSCEAKRDLLGKWNKYVTVHLSEIIEMFIV